MYGKCTGVNKNSRFIKFKAIETHVDVLSTWVSSFVDLGNADSFPITVRFWLNYADLTETCATLWGEGSRGARSWLLLVQLASSCVVSKPMRCCTRFR